MACHSWCSMIGLPLVMLQEVSGAPTVPPATPSVTPRIILASEGRVSATDQHGSNTDEDRRQTDSDRGGFACSVLLIRVPSVFIRGWIVHPSDSAATS